ncbi:MAG: protein-disulfide reductase DsbD [Gammaproteobacteria bacterium]|nr:protein-disulfide reductase DsbD [Gammaproteobacteria bacterium]
MKHLYTTLGTLLVLMSPTSWAQFDEPLDPKEAFAFSAQVTDANTLEARWKIAKGYYMYRGKISLEITGEGVSLGQYKLPAGKKKKDDFFGEVEIYTKAVKINLPLQRAAGASRNITLVANSQGCNEPIGVCYPPQTQKVKLTLPPLANTNRSKPNTLSSLSAFIDQQAGGGEFLDPDKAFRLTTEVVDGTMVRASIVIADGYYLYRDKTRFQLSAEGARLGTVNLPAGKEKVDEFFGKTQVFTQVLNLSLPIQRSKNSALSAELLASYQGCADEGICYPPINKKVSLKLPAVTAISSGKISSQTDSGSNEQSTDAGTATTSTPAGESKTKIYLVAIFSAFITGLLLTFTPCVLPMIPILSSIVVGQSGKQVSKTRGGTLALVYVLGTAVTYTAAGIFAGYSGDQLQAYFQNAWAIGVFSAILVLLALSMFGFYEIQMPSFIQSRLQSQTQKIRGGTFAGVFVMGLVSALIVGACVSPLLMAALGVAIVSQDLVLGGAIMFSMAMGMGVILVGLGMGAGFLMPKAGIWMDRIKYIFGVLLLGVAIYLIGVVARETAMYLWAALLIVSSVYLGAFQSLPEGTGGWRYFSKGLGLLILIWGILALLGGMSGNYDITRPLALNQIGGGQLNSGTRSSVVPASKLFNKTKSVQEIDRLLTDAKAADKPVMVDYYADWCNDCVRMENTTFANPSVQQMLRDNFVLLKIDVTDTENPNVSPMKKRFRVFGPPATIFLSASGRELKDHNFYGYKNAQDFIQTLEKVLAEK